MHVPNDVSAASVNALARPWLQRQEHFPTDGLQVVTLDLTCPQNDAWAIA